MRPEPDPDDVLAGCVDRCLELQAQVEALQVRVGAAQVVAEDAWEQVREARAERDEANRRAVSIGEKAGRALVEALAERDEAERGRQQALLAHAVEKQEKHNIETRLRAERDRAEARVAELEAKRNDGLDAMLAVSAERDRLAEAHACCWHDGHGHGALGPCAVTEREGAALAAEPREHARLCEHGHLVFLTSDKCIHGHRAAEPREPDLMERLQSPPEPREDPEP